LQKLAADINRRGWSTKSWTTKKGDYREGKQFSKSNLNRLLTNVTFIGCVSHKGQVFPGEHKGIIRKSTFDQVQSLLAKNLQTSRQKTVNKYGFLLKGLIRCGACGTAYVPTTTKKGSKIYRYYTCSGAQKNGYKTCPHPSIPAAKFEHLIVQQISTIGQDPKLQAETLKQVSRIAREQTSTLSAEEKRLRVELEKATSETSGLLTALAGGELTGTSVSNRLGVLEEKTDTLQRRLAELERERVAGDVSAIDPGELASALGMFNPIWDVLFPVEQARIIELLIERIEYNGESGNLSITFHPVGIKALAGEIA